MTSRVLRYALIAPSVLVVIAMASASARSGSPPRPIGRADQTLSAGVHILDLVALDTAGTGLARLPRISITLPRGWRSHKGFAVLKFRGDSYVMGLSFWDVNLVYGTPCRWQSRPMVSTGTTVARLASALAKQPLRNATAPTSTALAGFRGSYLRLTVPKTIDFARCDQGYFESWTGLGWSSDRYEQGPGQVDGIWILDVNGQRLVVDADYLPAATANNRAELDRVVHSIRFLPTKVRRTTVAAAMGRVDHVHVGPAVRNGDRIAYSTSPADALIHEAGWAGPGSDVFVSRAGGQPVLVAGRGDRHTWNLCPTFSRDGKLLAFARKSRGDSTIVVVGVTRGGAIRTRRLVLKVPGGRVRCPKWSADSSRLAYLYRGRVVVRDLGGLRWQRAAKDPTVHDFDRSKRVLVSPTGELIASLSNSTIVVSRPNLSDRRVIRDDPPSYAIAGWSPDGRKLLMMRDVGNGFTMRAVSVEPPFASVTISVDVPVNGARAWPGYGDVSWQPIPRS